MKIVIIEQSCLLVEYRRFHIAYIIPKCHFLLFNDCSIVSAFGVDLPLCFILNHGKIAKIYKREKSKKLQVFIDQFNYVKLFSEVVHGAYKHTIIMFPNSGFEILKRVYWVQIIKF